MTTSSLALALTATLTAAVAVSATPVPTAMPYDHKRTDVLGLEMAYVDEGAGDPVVFLHGNPTSSYLWRNIMPAVADTHRVIAPDLIGMGLSEKPDVAFSYAFHRDHLFAFLDALNLSNATLVVHDWGSGLGLDWAQANADRLSSIVMMEAILPPIWPVAGFDEMGEMGEHFKAFRTPGVGEQLIVEQNAMIEPGLSRQYVIHPLPDAAVDTYKGYYSEPGQRQVILDWTRSVPIGGEPADVVSTVERYSHWLQESNLPKMLIHAQPGVLVPPAAVEWLEARVPNLTTVDIGPGLHFLQEDNPSAIAAALETWVSHH